MTRPKWRPLGDAANCVWLAGGSPEYPASTTITSYEDEPAVYCGQVRRYGDEILDVWLVSVHPYYEMRMKEKDRHRMFLVTYDGSDDVNANGFGETLIEFTDLPMHVAYLKYPWYEEAFELIAPCIPAFITKLDELWVKIYGADNVSRF